MCALMPFSQMCDGAVMGDGGGVEGCPAKSMTVVVTPVRGMHGASRGGESAVLAA